MTLTGLTDGEILRYCDNQESQTALEIELAARLQRALDEIDRLVEEGFGCYPGGETQAQNQGDAEAEGNLAL